MYSRLRVKNLKTHKSHRVTLKDIAQIAGCTVNTVSHALHDRDDISKATKEKIKNIASELGYVENSLASSLRTGYSKTIAIIMSDISNPLFGILVKDIENYAREYRYNTILINTDENPDLEKTAIYSALEKKVDGLLICPTQKESSNIQYLRNKDIPFVLFGRYFTEFETDYIISDESAGAYKAVDYLIGKGCKNVLFLNGFKYISSSVERLSGYKSALEKHNIEYNPALVHEISVTSSSFNHIYDKLKQNKTYYDGIFTFSDLLALEILSTLRVVDPLVFDKIPIVGYDNILSNMFIPYPLSSINYDKNLMSKMLVETLINKITNPDLPLVQHRLPTTLVIR